MIEISAARHNRHSRALCHTLPERPPPQGLPPLNLGVSPYSALSCSFPEVALLQQRWSHSTNNQQLADLAAHPIVKSSLQNDSRAASSVSIRVPSWRQCLETLSKGDAWNSHCVSLPLSRRSAGVLGCAGRRELSRLQPPLRGLE